MKKLMLIILPILPLNVVAEDLKIDHIYKSSIDWNDNYLAGTFFEVLRIKDFVTKEVGYEYNKYYAKVSMSQNGKQRIYISHTGSKSKKGGPFSTWNQVIAHHSKNLMPPYLCDISDDITWTTTLNVNGQNVRFSSYCEDDGYTIMYTPESEAGLNYLIDQFKKSSYVAFKRWHRSETVNISAKGFTSYWNQFGGDAL